MRICGMPAAADSSAIRQILQTDRVWAVYALADLAPEYRAYACWHLAAEGRPALLLVYRGFQTPVLFAHGAAADLGPLLHKVADDPEYYLSVRSDFAALLAGAGYDIRGEKRMCRMVMEPRNFAPAEGRVDQLGSADHDALSRLYNDGDAAGEAPPFFDASMLRHGVYFGIREKGEFVAAAGTHVLSERESVAGIGNVYTRRDRRGRGLGSQVTSAVASELLRLKLRTIALNVEESNRAAVRIYERLGFRKYCEYREGMAVRRNPNAPDAPVR